MYYAVLNLITYNGYNKNYVLFHKFHLFIETFAEAN